MQKIFVGLIVALSLIAMVATGFAAPMPSLPVADKSWEEISKDDGIVTHRKEVEGSDIVAFRGEAVIEAPIAKVSNILIDTSRKKEWVAKIIEAKDIRPISEYERIEYNATSSGFFAVSDRDFVFRAKAQLNKEKGQVVFTLNSVEDPLAPETDRVRGSLNESKYVLTSLDGGKRTHMVVEIHADPKGSVPKWLVNLFQKSWPRKTIENIQKQAAKPDVTEHAGIKAYFEGTANATPAERAGQEAESPVQKTSAKAN